LVLLPPFNPVQAQTNLGQDYLCQWNADLHFFQYYHWRWSELPLKVYIPALPSKLKPKNKENYPALVKQAFLNWSAQFPALKFEWVNQAQKAQILVQWQEKYPESETAWGKAALPQPFLAKQSQPRIQHQSTLQLAIKASERSVMNPASVYFTQEEILAVSTHAIGHALGLMHSGNPDDLMYHAFYARFDGSWKISPADLASLERLFNLPEDLEISPCNG